MTGFMVLLQPGSVVMSVAPVPGRVCRGLYSELTPGAMLAFKVQAAARTIQIWVTYVATQSYGDVKT